MQCENEKVIGVNLKRTFKRTFRKTLKRGVACMCLVSVLVSTVACSNALKGSDAPKEKIDVVMWNTYGDRFPAASGFTLMEHVAKTYEEKTGVEVNLINVNANSQDAYFEAREELLSSDDQPEMLLFNTRCADELHQMEIMKDALLPLEGVIENYDDVFDGMKSERYSALSVLAYGNMMNRTLVDSFGQNSSVAFLSTQEVEELFMKWADTSVATMNIFDYELFLQLGFSNLFYLTNDTLQFDQQAMIEKVKKCKAFIETLPKRELTKDEILNFNTDTSSELFVSEAEEYAAIADQRPVNYLTQAAFNAFDLLDFSKQIDEKESGFIISDYSLSVAVGFGILNNGSEEQAKAVDFANYLLSSEFQRTLKDYSTERLKMSGTVLKSVQEEQYQMTQDNSLTFNGKPIPESVIHAHKQLMNQYNQPLALQHMALSSQSEYIGNKLMEITAEYIWGDQMTEESLKTTLEQLEVEVQAMVKH